MCARVNRFDGMNKHILEKIKEIRIKNKAKAAPIAATKIQKVIRGNKTRKILKENKQNNLNELQNELTNIFGTDRQQNIAAI